MSSFRPSVLLLFPVACLWFGCSEPPPVRRYLEMTGTAAPLQVSTEANGSNTFSRVEPPSSAAPWRWTAPEGWKPTPAEGMRLAGFETPGGALCTVIVLAGDAGGIVPNLRRWVGQLGTTPPDEETLRAFAEGAPSLVTVNGAVARMYDLGRFAAENSDADTTLVTVLPRGTESAFVKLTGPRDAVAAARPAFQALCESLQ